MRHTDMSPTVLCAALIPWSLAVLPAVAVLPAEVFVLGGLVGGVVVLASYTVKKTLLNNEAGS